MPLPGQPVPRSEQGGPGLTSLGMAPAPLPYRCELHLQGGLCGRRLLVQWEHAAGPHVLVLAHGLPGSTYPVSSVLLQQGGLRVTNADETLRGAKAAAEIESTGLVGEGTIATAWGGDL